MKGFDCPLKNVGQTVRAFRTGYREHIQDIRNNKSSSGYSTYILDIGHRYGTVTDTMDIITQKRKTVKHNGKITLYSRSAKLI
jgi:hypothetical protein